MNGGRGCARGRRKMDKGGSTTEEKPSYVSSAPIATITAIDASPEPTDATKSVSLGNSVDSITQARKTLTLLSPFDTEEPTQLSTSGASGNVGRVSSTLLPGAWALFMAKHSESRNKHKKSHSAREHKKRVEKTQSRGLNFWDRVEEYFRELSVDDIDRLHVSSLGVSISDNCIRIPSHSTNDYPGNSSTVSRGCYMCRMSDLLNMDSVECVHGGSLNGTGVKADDMMDENEQVMSEDVMDENEQEHLDVDIVGGVHEEIKEQRDIDSTRQKGPPISCLEWLLGSKNKVYLTTERPSKKRKLLGGDAGLEKILVPHPVEGSASLCHYCSNGDFDGESNRLITCTSCGMSVHWICYGVQSDFDENWLCSWCKNKGNQRNVERPCLLCPKGGGALKPVQIGENAVRLVNYAHLFCCQWIPEAYVENTRVMEPIVNIDRINDTRKKLICYLCKLKYGVCVRCSNGACRASFHPICAREAGHRMEIWGRLGCDEVELRAFCSKHSDTHNNPGNQSAVKTSVLVSSDSKLQPVSESLNKLTNFKDCIKDEQPLTNCAADKGTVEGVDGPCDQDCFDLLKQLIVKGIIDMKDATATFGVPVDALALNNLVVPNLRFKLIEWLRNHGFIGNLLDTKYKSYASEECEAYKGDADFKSLLAAEPGNGSLVPVKSAPPQKTKSDLRILKSDGGMGATNEVCKDMLIDEDRNHLASQESYPCKEFPDAIMKNSGKAAVCQEILAGNSCEAEGAQIADTNVSISNNGQSNEAAEPLNIIRTNLDVPNSTFADPPSNQMHDNFKLESYDYFVHPFIQHKLLGMDGHEYDGDRKSSQFGTSSSSGHCCSQHNQQRSSDLISKIYGSNLEQLVNARNMGLLALSPTSEVEGELIFYQHRLLSNSDTRKRLIDGLISKVCENLQQEIDVARKSQWDAVLISQYLHDLREAKKQERKERRHIEAQAILAAATAAVASSTRNSSLRKDSLSEPVHVEDTSSIRTSNGRAGTHSHQNSRAKESSSRSAATGLLPDKHSGPLYLTPDPSVEHIRICDICQRSETKLNPISVCSNCKVTVHLDCYRKVRKSSGPWYCELCEELKSSRGPGTSTSDSWEKPYYVAECGLCGGTAGAFRKSIDGQWIHAFCAEWVLESKITRGQVHHIEGMETLSKGDSVCDICGQSKGVCIKCNNGNCQSSFHPTCARRTSLYMNVRSIGGKLQRKAYCGKHSLEQKTKAEKLGVEEFNRLRQVRVELERLRLLCERIIKREKFKRELVLCSHDILSSMRDTAVFSALSHNHHLCHGEASSESATTSTRGCTEGNNGSDTVQRSDDLTVDSSSRVAGKSHFKILTTIDSDQKTDDSSVSQHVTPIPVERASLSGKQIPSRATVVVGLHTSLNAAVEKAGSKKNEIIEKEMIMTSDEASMKNQRLPKGFVYVPYNRLPAS